MSQINKKYLDILKQIDEEHKGAGDLHRNSKTLVEKGIALTLPFLTTTCAQDTTLASL